KSSGVVIPDKFVHKNNFIVDRRRERVRLREKVILWVVFNRTHRRCPHLRGYRLIMRDFLRREGERQVYLSTTSNVNTSISVAWHLQCKGKGNLLPVLVVVSSSDVQRF